VHVILVARPDTASLGEITSGSQRMQASFCVAPGNRLRGSGAKRDAATVNLLAPCLGDLGIRASLEAFEQSDNKRRPLLGGESQCLVQDVVNPGIHPQDSNTGQRRRASTCICLTSRRNRHLHLSDRLPETERSD
jgi:hypothetical protein